jgi:CO/xanthine dehydrogenase FAD-binding subunit
VKPAPFDYEAPRSIEEALRLVGEEARPLAGGQSLVPMLNYRLARPAMLVDLNRIESLAFLEPGGSGDEQCLRIGALTRQAALERSGVVAARWPLLGQAVRLVGHPAIRNRGTVGGSAAHADPAAELPVALTALDACFVVRSLRGGERRVPPERFFTGALSTALEPDELLCEIEVPALPPGTRTAFVEHARTHGDFATAGAAVVLTPGERAAVALLGAGSSPVRAPAAEHAMVRGDAAPTETAVLATEMVRDEYRRAVLAELVRGAVEQVMR